MSNSYYFTNKRTIPLLAIRGIQFYVCERAKFISILLFQYHEIRCRTLSVYQQEIKLQKLFIYRATVEINAMYSAILNSLVHDIIIWTIVSWKNKLWIMNSNYQFARQRNQSTSVDHDDWLKLSARYWSFTSDWWLWRRTEAAPTSSVTHPSISIALIAKSISFLNLNLVSAKRGLSRNIQSAIHACLLGSYGIQRYFLGHLCH